MEIRPVIFIVSDFLLWLALCVMSVKLSYCSTVESTPDAALPLALGTNPILMKAFKVTIARKLVKFAAD